MNMRPTLHLWNTGLAIAVLILCACTKPSEPYATESSTDAFMQVISLDNKDGPRPPIQLALPPGTTSDPEINQQQEANYCFESTSGISVTVSEENAVLLLAAARCEKDGEWFGPTVLAAYRFHKRDGKWFRQSQNATVSLLSVENPSMTFKRIPQKTGRPLIAVEHFNCGGSCDDGWRAEWLHLVQVDVQSISYLTDPAHPVMTSSRDDECPDGFHEAKVGETIDAIGYFRGCRVVRANWKILPSNKGLGDLVIEFSGKTTGEPVENVQSRSSEPASALADASAPQADVVSVPAERRARIEPVKGRQVFRLNNDRYTLLSGRYPDH